MKRKIEENWWGKNINVKKARRHVRHFRVKIREIWRISKGISNNGHISRNFMVFFSGLFNGDISSVKISKIKRLEDLYIILESFLETSLIYLKKDRKRKIKLCVGIVNKKKGLYRKWVYERTNRVLTKTTKE